ncbi:prisilkin-39-like [Euwallacea similis]|uniref:prisilkin-39-like n=1 Tax=Euwallacea similis TaxID=1736056 RepID=UPI00344D813D
MSRLIFIFFAAVLVTVSGLSGHYYGANPYGYNSYYGASPYGYNNYYYKPYGHSYGGYGYGAGGYGGYGYGGYGHGGYYGDAYGPYGSDDYDDDEDGLGDYAGTDYGYNGHLASAPAVSYSVSNLYQTHPTPFEYGGGYGYAPAYGAHYGNYNYKK